VRALGVVSLVLFLVHPVGFGLLGKYQNRYIHKMVNSTRYNLVYPAGKPKGVVDAEKKLKKMRKKKRLKKERIVELDKKISSIESEMLNYFVESKKRNVKQSLGLLKREKQKDLAQLALLKHEKRKMLAQITVSGFDREIKESIRKSEEELSEITSLVVGTTLLYAEKRDNNLIEFMLRIPVRILVLVLSPLPWQTGSNFLKIAIVENFILYAFLILAILGYVMKIPFQTYSSPFLFAYLLISLFVYGVTEGNLGTAYRHRMQFLWILYIPGCVFLENLLPWQREEGKGNGF